MTIYYVKQDNSIWGCGEADCCGEWYEEIDETFVDCDCGISESQMNGDHLQGCVGGGPVLEWRKADNLEVQAFEDGKSDGFQEGSDWGIEWQKERTIKILETEATKESDYCTLPIDPEHCSMCWHYDRLIALIKGEK